MYNSNTTNVVRPTSSSMVGPPPMSANSASRRTIAATTGPPPFNPNNRVPTAVVATPTMPMGNGQPPNPFFRPPYPNNNPPTIPNGMIPNNMGGYMPQPMWSSNVPVSSPSMRSSTQPVQNNFMPPNSNNNSMSLSVSPSSAASRNRSVSIGSAPFATDPNEAKSFDELLSTFYSDPVRIDEISRMDLFCIRSALPKTTFEEIDIFSSYFGHGSSVDASSFGANLLLNDDNNNTNSNSTIDNSSGQNSVISSLRHAIRKLYLEAFRDDDKFSASLLSYHLLLYKRLKILEKVQEFQHSRMNSTQSLKVQFEQLPSNTALSIAVDHNIDKPSTTVIATCALSSVPVNTTEMTQVAEHQYQPLKREDLDAFTKNLIKAMQKSDVKKGIFAKLRKSKSESIYKIITKYAYPLCLPLEILDMESLNPVKQYLVEYSLDKENGLKRRTKSIHSMLLLALSTGSLLDMLQVLQCILSLSENPDEPLIDAETEEEGSFVMRAETLKPLQQFQYLIKMHLDQLEKESSHTPGKNNDLPTYLLPQHIWNDPNYSLISFSSNGVSLNFNWKKPYLTAKRLFLFLLNQIDMLATHYLYCDSYSTINSQGDLVIELGDSKNINSLLNHREKFLKNKISANIKFSIELGSPRTFSSILDIIDSMLQIQSNSSSELNGVKNYSIAALFRILHLNVKALSLWKKGRENVNQLVQHRMSSSTGYSNVNFIESMKGYFLGFLKEIDTDLENNQDGLKSFETIHETKPQSSQSRTKDPNIKEQPRNQQKTTQDQKRDVTTNPFILNLFGSATKENVQEEQQTNYDIEENEDFVVISTTPGHKNNREQPPTPEEVKNVSKYRAILAALAPQTFMSKFISEKMLDILVTGFSIFYPSPEEQRFFLEDSISILSNGGKSNSASLLSSSTEVPLRRNFLKKLLERLVNDFTLFEKLIANGIGMSDVSVVIPFTEKLLEFIKRQEQFKMAEVLSKLSKFTTEKDIKPNDIYMHEDLEIIANLVKQLMIMWQNFLFHYVHSIFSKSSVSNSNGVVNSILGTNTGKVLFEYSKLILNQTEEVLNEMCKISAEIIEVKSKVDKSSVDEVNSLLTIEICEGILQKGATGWLCFPLLLNFAKFLWKGSILSNSKSAAGNVVIESQLEKLTQFLYPPVVNLLRMLDLLSQFCDIQEFKSEAEKLLIDWTIVETEHPYDGNVTDWKEINFSDPNNNIINVGIKFDPRCITSGPEDHLRINSLQKIASLQALQFSGHGTTIPVNPLLTWGAGMSCSFKSGNFALNSSEGGKQGSMWGMRCMVVPVRSFSAPPLFMYEFSKLLGHIGGRCSTYLFSTYPYSSDEDKYVEWLESKIFANGIKGEIGQPTEQNTEKQSNNNNNGLLLLRMEEDFSKTSLMYQQSKTIAPGKFGSNPYDLNDKTDSDSSSSDMLDVNDKFLIEMIEPTSNNSAPINFCNYMYQRILNKESFIQMMQQVSDVVSAERAVIAAVLKHTGLDSLARKVAESVAESPFLLSENADKDSYEKSMSLLDVMFKNGDYEKLKLMWRKVGRTLREWMIKTKQQKQLSYRDMRDFIVQKCKFLISLESAFMSTVPMDARDVGTPEKSLFKKVQSPRTLEKSSLLSQQLTHTFVFNRFKKGNMGSFTNILPDDDFVGDISSQIVKFIQSDIIPVRIQNLMRMRSERALNRATALQMFSELLQSTQFSTVKAEIVHGIKAVRQNRSMKKIDSPNFHYFNNVEGSGPMYSDILSTSLCDFLKQLFQPLDACINTSSQEEKERNLKVLVQSGLLREILDICLISFKHNDIKWIMQFDFLEKLSYLMYNTVPTPEQNTDKFKRRDGYIEEQKEINKKSWKIFRLLSIRCVEMLEENAITDPVIESQLNDLRDTVFNLLFKDLKRVIGDMNSEISSEVLEEMLSLMVSLSNTPSAQSCLSSERFQQLLLPLLRLESYPKVQELSLKLCGQLITSYGELSTDNNYSEGLKELLTILFEFLGAYETKQVTGDSSLINDKDGSGSIGMKMAKDIFNLIRKLFKDIPVDDHSSAPYFVGVLTSLMDQAINVSTQNILQSIKKGKTNVLKDIQLVYSTLTVLNGFNCIPQIGEIVNVDMNGRVEKAKVKEIEETYHLIKIELCDKTVIHREHFVSAENVKVQSNLPIEKFDLQRQHVHSLFKFITELGVMVNGTDLSLDDKILYSNLWMRSLRWLLDAISTQNNYSAIVTDTLLGADSDYTNMLEKLVSLGEKATIFQTLANETNKSLITYGKDLKLDSCSFTFTGKKFHKQYYYSCQTCSMNTNQAVCAFCARTCHRGHRLGTLEVGDFYCDCGAGEAAAKTHGTSNCKSLRNASPDPILTTERMESVMLRLQKLMPISSKRNQSDSLDFVPNSPTSVVNTSTNNQPVQKGPTKFVVATNLVQDGVPYAITNVPGDLPLVTFNPMRLYSPKHSIISTDFSIPMSWPGFYFEVELVDSGESFAIGFSLPYNPTSVITYKTIFSQTQNMYTWHTEAGTLYKGNTIVKNSYPTATTKDVIGCGFIREQKIIFFTKNGVNLGTSFQNVDLITLNPIIAMKGKNVQAKVNISMFKPFQFNLPRNFKSLLPIYSMNAAEVVEPNQPMNRSTQPVIQNELSVFESRVKELKSVVNGLYSEDDIRRVLASLNNMEGSNLSILNFALSVLHRNMQPQVQVVTKSNAPTQPEAVPVLRLQLVEQMKLMGFSNDKVCLKALQLANDDINLALNYVFEGVVVEDAPPLIPMNSNNSISMPPSVAPPANPIIDRDEYTKKNEKSVNDILLFENSGVPLLGSEYNNSDMKQRLLKAMLQNPDMKINENNFCDSNNLREGDLVVVSPRIVALAENNNDSSSDLSRNKKTAALSKLRGKLGVVSRKVTYGPYVMVAEEQGASSIVTDLVESKNVYTAPHELKGITINDVPAKCLEFYMALSSTYIRTTILKVLTKASEMKNFKIDLPKTFSTKKSLMKGLKLTLLDAYHHLDSDYNFISSYSNNVILEKSVDYDNNYTFANKSLPSIETFESWKNMEITNSESKVSNIFLEIEEEALNDLNSYTLSLNNYRKYDYRKDMNALHQQPSPYKQHFIQFYGATSIAIILGEKFELPTTLDNLTFYFDRNGKKVALQIKGGTPIQDRCIIITTNNYNYFNQTEQFANQAQLYFEFTGPSVRENNGVTFYAAPYTTKLSQRDAFLQPNLLLSSMVLKYSAISRKSRKVDVTAALYFPIMARYILTPFAPFKGIVADALGQLDYSSPIVFNSHIDPMSHTGVKDSIVKSGPAYAHLSLLKRFRVELEDLYRKYLRYNENSPHALHNFHALTEFMTVIRKYLVSDLCQSMFPSASSSLSNLPTNLANILDKHHMYSCKLDQQHYGRTVERETLACTSCTHSVAKQLSMYETKTSSFAKYFANESTKCQSQVAMEFQIKYDHENSCNVSTSVVPIGTTSETVSKLFCKEDNLLQVNPSDWFEHVSWVDQLTIIREFLETFTSNNGRTFPEWTLFESILEKRKKVCYKESKHPYSIVNDSDKIKIPGAKTLYITFDKHSKTHKCDRLLFSTKKAGSDDLGSFGGDELKDKTIVVHGTDSVYYDFTCCGGDHDVKCSGCRSNITGVRYHCVECEEYDLCEKCVSKQGRVHSDLHLFLKIRRPVDCMPAMIPSLYTPRWRSTSQFKGNIHVGVKCDNCGVNPIKGIRYWCENCENFNLCEKCAETEFKYHDRMHIFLRVVRPLPPKNQMPANALPYGLVYEKDMDSHWGYMFSVSSSIEACPRISQVQNEIDEIRTLMKIGKDNKPMGEDDVDPVEFDKQLLEYVETYSNGWQSLEWNQLSPKKEELTNLPLLDRVPLNRLRYRFVLLKLFNRRISRIINILDFTNTSTIERKNDARSVTITDMISQQLRDRIFYSVKMDAWQHTIMKSHVTVDPIHLKLNRHLASEMHPTDRQRNAFNSLFIQAFNQVKSMHPKILSRKQASWKVTLIGEAADDYGGPFRESLSNMCQELITNDPAILDLFIPTPNKVSGQGDNRDKFVPTPKSTSDQHLKWYEFVGMLMGIGILTKNVLPFDYPSLIWKGLVNEKIGWTDLRSFDEEIYNAMKSILELGDVDDSDYELKAIMEDSFSQTYYGRMLTTMGSDGKEVELVPNGSDIELSYNNRKQYANLIYDYRLTKEFNSQLNAIRKGLFNMLTNRYFSLFSWHELEKNICGVPDVDVEKLKQHTIYEGYTIQSREIKHFWEIMQAFSPEQRSLFLKFVWGRGRMPYNESEAFSNPMKIQKLDRPNPDIVLPLSHTCFFSIELPCYSTKEIMKEKLLYAIINCKAIDIDFTTTAIEAQNAIAVRR